MESGLAARNGGKSGSSIKVQSIAWYWSLGANIVKGERNASRTCSSLHCRTASYIVPIGTNIRRSESFNNMILGHVLFDFCHYVLYDTVDTIGVKSVKNHAYDI